MTFVGTLLVGQFLLLSCLGGCMSMNEFMDTSGIPILGHQFFLAEIELTDVSPAAKICLGIFFRRDETREGQGA
jgi:hypothetical protein